MKCKTSLEKSWLNNHSGFKIKCQAGEAEQYISSCYKDGQKQGYFYRAWQEIFSANHLYAALFKQYSTVNMENSDTAKQKLPPPQQDNRTLAIIKEHIENIDGKSWQYSFRTEVDYNAFTSLLTAYFEQRDYTLPAETIQLNRRCKTKLAKALGEILRELSDGVLKDQTEYFDIIRTLNHFENDDIYKTITR